MAESKLEKLRKTKKRSMSNVIMVALVIGFIILIVDYPVYNGFLGQNTGTWTKDPQ